MKKPVVLRIFFGWVTGSDMSSHSKKNKNKKWTFLKWILSLVVTFFCRIVIFHNTDSTGWTIKTYKPLKLQEKKKRVVQNFIVVYKIYVVNDQILKKKNVTKPSY